jgi:hypothetical protein
MKTIAAVLLVVLVAACAPQTIMVQHGNEFIQVTQTYGLFGTNVVERTKCAQGALVNGFCPAEKSADYSHMYAEGPGKDLAKSVILGGAIVGGMMALRPNDSRMTQSVTQNASPFGGSHISTQYLNGQVPPWLLQ